MSEYAYQNAIINTPTVVIDEIQYVTRELHKYDSSELDALGIIPVKDTPTINDRQYLEWHDGSVVDGEWVRFTVKEKTAETLMAEIRAKRNQLLADTDWTALVDSTLTDEMKTYRQALRDLPETVDVNKPVYPEKP